MISAPATVRYFWEAIIEERGYKREINGRAMLLGLINDALDAHGLDASSERRFWIYDTLGWPLSDPSTWWISTEVSRTFPRVQYRVEVVFRAGQRLEFKIDLSREE